MNFLNLEKIMNNKKIQYSIPTMTAIYGKEFAEYKMIA